MAFVDQLAADRGMTKSKLFKGAVYELLKANGFRSGQEAERPADRHVRFRGRDDSIVCGSSFADYKQFPCFQGVWT